MMFENRQEAGKELASKLLKYRGENPYILAMPRGGVPVGFEVAEVLHAPLDVIVVRKIGLFSNPEFGIGAIAEGGVRVLDQTTIGVIGIDEEEIEDTIKLEEEELKRRVRIYREGKPPPNLTGKTAILVDDGMATGITARAAIEAVKKLNPKKIVLASPVCALDTVESLKKIVDEVICLATPFEFMAVGSWYRDFEQISDEEVVDLLKKHTE
ncbi:phosphoribosyltransferase [Candidatus Daviesbacteria bacterium]|nr:phosphoribosyltransferase [Candidatus Daviesbacteria bacterium]